MLWQCTLEFKLGYLRTTDKHFYIIEKFSLFFCVFNGLFSQSWIKSQSDSDFFASYGR